MFKIIGAALVTALIGSPVFAATLTGDTIEVSYTTTKSPTPIVFTYTVPASPFNIPKDPSGSGSITGNTVSYTFGRDFNFDNLGLASATFTDTTPGKMITGATLDVDTTVTGLTLSTNSATDSFTVGFAGVTAMTGDVIDLTVSVSGTIGAVPLPPSAAMFGASLVLLGAVGFGLRRTKGAAAV